ncbi:MAG TPA: hypothetical protein VMY34_10555, partial [Acidimicrobiales bacterium]|nr:hypothetical protein [Acidimicrobiales bacterium]
LAAALVGGLTSLPGALVGGLFVGVVEQIIEWRSDTLGLTETVLFVVVILVLIFRPQGLFGQKEETEDKVAFIPAMRELPARLRATPYARYLRLGWLMVASFAIALSLVTGPSTNGVLIDVIVFSIVGVSLTILLGWSGQISLGHWGLVGVGAFAMANLHTRVGVPYLLAIPMSVVVGMFVALVIGLPALRIRGLYLGVATLAFSVASHALLFKSQLIGKGTTGITVEAPKVGPIDLGSLSNRPLFFFSLAMFGLVLLFARNLQGTRTYRSFVALRENEKAAATLGIGLTKYKLIAFVISGGIAALAGALYATRLGVAEQTTWDPLRSLQLVAMVMIGGLGSLSGSVFGAVIVFGIQGFFELRNPWIIPIGTGILLIVVITRLPGGIAGMVQNIRGRIVESLDDMDQARHTDESGPARDPVGGVVAPARTG